MIILLIIILIFAVYYYSTRKFNYWAQRNVKHDRPIPLFGTHQRNLFGIKSITDISVELYNKYPEEKCVGYYRGNIPQLIIRDLELIRYILNVEFNSFYNRGLGGNTELQPMYLNLFTVEGDTWKMLRQRLNPAFTPTKLKNMFPLIINCANKLQVVANNLSESNKEHDIRDLMARFTTDFIGACGFGVDMDSINNEKSEFRQLGKNIFTTTYRIFILTFLVELIPELNNYINVVGNEIRNVVVELFKKIREQRNYKPIGRNDFIDLLLELESKGKITCKSIETKNPDGTPVIKEMEMDIECMAAQVLVFFAAGFETSSSITSFILHQLAFHPDVQEKIQQEIDEVLSKYDNKLCYDAVAEMSYLEMAFKEAMRMFPSGGVLNRECTRKCTLPGTDITLDPGVKIIIPVQAIQNDEKYFDEPHVFRPERFSPGNMKNIPKYTFLPFGEGARQCIGARLGQMQSLAGVAALLQQFSVEPGPNTKRHLTTNPLSNEVQSVIGGVPLMIRKRKLQHI